MKQNKKFVDTDPYTYAELCEKYKVFSMPDNQRPYAWKSANVEGLWEALIENNVNYFIGNVVALEPSDDTDQTLVIVDGQQRLTTLSLFLIGIKNVLKSTYEDDENIEKSLNLVDYYLNWVNPADHSKVKRLNPGKEMLEATYREILDGKQYSQEEVKKLQDSQKRFISNLKQIENLVRKQLKKLNPDEVQEKIVDKVLGAQIIAIVVETEDDIYDLFEGLNSTGLGLSIADLLKNAVLKSVTDKNAKNEIQTDWLSVETFFEDTKVALFPKFLKHYWTANYKLVTLTKLFAEIKTTKLKNKSTKQVKEFTDNLLENARFYIALKYEDYDNYLSKITKDKKVKKLISKIRLISDLDQMDAVLLALCNKKNIHKSYKPSIFASDLEKLLHFSILNKFSSINPSDYENIFARICKAAREELDEIGYKKKVGPEFKKLKQLVSNEKDFAEAFATKAKYGVNSKLIEYVLIEMMKQHSNKDNNIEVSDPNIEHILPQRPAKWSLGEDQVSEYVNLVGNLTILSETDNNDAGNDTFEEKVKKIYSKSSFQFNRDLVKYGPSFKKDPKSAIYKRGLELGVGVYNLLLKKC